MLPQGAHAPGAGTRLQPDGGAKQTARRGWRVTWGLREGDEMKYEPAFKPLQGNPAFF